MKFEIGMKVKSLGYTKLGELEEKTYTDLVVEEIVNHHILFKSETLGYRKMIEQRINKDSIILA